MTQRVWVRDDDDADPEDGGMNSSDEEYQPLFGQEEEEAKINVWKVLHSEAVGELCGSFAVGFLVASALVHSPDQAGYVAGMAYTALSFHSKRLLNPLVTLSVLLSSKRFSVGRALLHVLMQTVGYLAGCMVVALVAGSGTFTKSVRPSVPRKETFLLESLMSGKGEKFSSVVSCSTANGIDTHLLMMDFGMLRSPNHHLTLSHMSSGAVAYMALHVAVPGRQRRKEYHCLTTGALYAMARLSLEAYTPGLVNPALSAGLVISAAVCGESMSDVVVWPWLVSAVLACVVASELFLLTYPRRLPTERPSLRRLLSLQHPTTNIRLSMELLNELIGVAMLEGLRALQAPGPAVVAFFIAVVYSSGYVSGPVLNPAIDFALLLVGQIDLKKALLLTAAQVLGGLGGYTLIYSIVKNAPSAPAPEAGVNNLEAFLIEGLLSCLLIYVVLHLIHPGHKDTGLAGIIVAAIVGANAFSASTTPTGALFNPAVALAEAFFTWMLPPYSTPRAVWLYVVAPYCGAILSFIMVKVERRHD